ncbi:tRNA-dihydrouridine synthase, partial [Erwinia amylovora]|uniref:tRNA-dihydrouridine synthase n=1 Tax=Erwinia amylovora TaxID=552 RepID=UPI0020C0E8C7
QEIILKVGCRSDRVQNGRFCACLLGEAQLVAYGIKAMRDVVSVPVTVKTRIGVDVQDSYEFRVGCRGRGAVRGGEAVGGWADRR